MPNNNTLRKPLKLLATVGGLGYCPYAPGTLGSLAAALAYPVVSQLAVMHYVVLLLGLLLLGIPLCHYAADNTHDPGWIVYDEWVGQWISYIGITATWPHLLLGFLLFRMLDISKPWPIAWCDRQLPGGYGIMLDDEAAGIISCLIMHLLSTLV